jgi:hypothetical protein
MAEADHRVVVIHVDGKIVEGYDSELLPVELEQQISRAT